MKLEERREDIDIHVPAQHNPLIEQAQDNINNSVEIKTLMKVINVNAIDRLGMTDHGPIHFQIVANIALKLARQLKKSDIKLSIEEDYGLSRNHGELVIFLASVFHDMGMSINRSGHEEFSLILTNDLLKGVLDFLPEEERTIVKSEALHAIISHRKGGTPYTIEAGIVRVADALDMTKGRSRISYEKGSTSIHTLSHAEIESVDIKDGDKKPIHIDIAMYNSAGFFQVDELLRSKLKGSGLEDYISVRAYIKGDSEANTIDEVIIE